MPNPADFADRYVALWNEPDADARRTAIAELWAPDGRHILQPPRETVDSAAALGLAATFEAHGHRELEQRVRLAYDEFVAPGHFTFRRRPEVTKVSDAIKFTWEMVSATGEVAGVGTEFLLVDSAGQIVADYQFIES
ncbi:hypothetical protein [Actinokineospora diospyrosa]|uniref:SnoaL-like protein n=1 Tax=Actinokineospora diospyrosa TaxID=103728 RepID=A0ABT1IEY3_9PSEU|nr:hypothetical protein [Actinokineospora diospyrosa]MCP2271175.1 hypothetical protein [Actinokineospora diospyrosa]